MSFWFWLMAAFYVVVVFCTYAAMVVGGRADD